MGAALQAIEAVGGIARGLAQAAVPALAQAGGDTETFAAESPESNAAASGAIRRQFTGSGATDQGCLADLIGHQARRPGEIVDGGVDSNTSFG